MKHIIRPASNCPKHINSCCLGYDYPAKYNSYSDHSNKPLFEPPTHAGHATRTMLGRILRTVVRDSFAGVQRGVRPLRYIVILLELCPSLVHIGDAARRVLIFSLLNHLQDMKNYVLIPWL